MKQKIINTPTQPDVKRIEQLMLGEVNKTLEERAAQYDGKIGPYEEYDWGKPQGRELW